MDRMETMSFRPTGMSQESKEGAALETGDKGLCPVCSSAAKTVLIRRHEYAIFKCTDCKLTYKYIPNLNRDLTQSLQDDTYRDSTLLARTRSRLVHKMAADRLHILQGQMKSGRLLEVGCASGEFLALAKEDGFDVQGVDSSKLFVDFNRQNGIEVKHGRVEDFDFHPRSFDAIALFHLIEHVEDPLGFVQTLAPLLRQDGLLFVATPNIASLTSKIFGLSYPGYLTRDHLTFFGEDTLTDVLRRGGFDVVDSFSKEYPHHLFSSTLGFLSNAVRARRQLSTDVVSGDKERVAEKATATPHRIKRTLAQVVCSSPSVLGFFFYCVLRPVGLILERTMKGHELWVVAKPSRSR